MYRREKEIFQLHIQKRGEGKKRRWINENVCLYVLNKNNIWYFRFSFLMDLSIVNNDFYLSGMAALVDDIDSKKTECLANYFYGIYLLRTVNGYATWWSNSDCFFKKSRSIWYVWNCISVEVNWNYWLNIDIEKANWVIL